MDQDSYRFPSQLQTPHKGRLRFLWRIVAAAPALFIGAMFLLITPQAVINGVNHQATRFGIESGVGCPVIGGLFIWAALMFVRNKRPRKQKAWLTAYRAQIIRQPADESDQNPYRSPQHVPQLEELLDARPVSPWQHLGSLLLVLFGMFTLLHGVAGLVIPGPLWGSPLRNAGYVAIGAGMIASGLRFGQGYASLKKRGAATRQLAEYYAAVRKDLDQSDSGHRRRDS